MHSRMTSSASPQRTNREAAAARSAPAALALLAGTGLSLAATLAAGVQPSSQDPPIAPPGQVQPAEPAPPAPAVGPSSTPIDPRTRITPPAGSPPAGSVPGAYNPATGNTAQPITTAPVTTSPVTTTPITSSPGPAPISPTALPPTFSTIQPLPVSGAPVPPAPPARNAGAPANGAAAPTTSVILPGAGEALREGSFRYGPFAEPVKLKLIADQVAAELNIQYLSTDTSIADKQVFLPTAIDVPRDQLLDFLALLLEQNGLILKSTGINKIYQVDTAANGGAGVVSSSAYSTTQIIRTPGIRPSSLATAIAALPKTLGAQQGNAAVAGPIAYLDDIGVILITDTPRRIHIITSLIEALAAEQARQEFTRFELKFLAAAAARTRIIELVGRPNPNQVQNPINQGQPQQLPQNQATISNLPDRLYVDSTGNALLFRGRTDEVDMLRHLLNVVDIQNTLSGKFYSVASPGQIAQQAERVGLGKVVTFQSGPQQQQNQFNAAIAAQQQGLNSVGDQSNSGGPVIMVDSQGRGFTYIATPVLHDLMDTFIAKLKDLTESEAVVYEIYKIKHHDAEDIATLVQAIINNTTPTGNSTSPLLGNNVPTPQINPNRGQNALNQRRNIGGDNENLAIEASGDVFVVADKGNNQVIVKAPQRLQPQFSRLIGKLDLRRPQVYIEATIVVIDDNDSWRLAFESQYVQGVGSQTTLAARSIFGPATSRTSLTGTPTISPALNAFTFAVIKSDQVPIVITALQEITDARVIAQPRLLVDDNVESEITAVREVATTTTSQSGAAGSTITGFGSYQEAGPKLKVKPQISSGDYLRLEYELELSSFIGTVVEGTGIPPSRSTSRIKSESVTVPSDSTIIVGGLTLDDTNKTIRQVPIIGDIPIIGQLFRDQSESRQRRLIYVFLTPRVMRDPLFADVRLLSQKPLAQARVLDPMPAMLTASDRDISRPPAFDPKGNAALSTRSPIEVRQSTSPPPPPQPTPTPEPARPAPGT
ncbi:hypothetical protein BH11PLA1_BH11PLA1_05750 [soil metagenome]